MPTPGTSARLRFREMVQSDLDAMSALLADVVVMRYYPAPKTRAEASRWIAWNQDNYATHGLGYATEAAAACLTFARTHTNAETVVAILHPENRASERVAEKLGMTRVADDRGGSLPRRVLSVPIPRDGSMER